MAKLSPVVMVSSYPPRLCGIATFCEEAREFIQKRYPERDVLVISHIDGIGEGVFPIIDMSKSDWWKPVAKKINELAPYAVHVEHEYGLYEYIDARGGGDNNRGLLTLLEAISQWPTIIEPHTVHGRLRDAEAEFIYELCERAGVVLLKCDYQKWRLEWNFNSRGWDTPKNVMVVPHGARADKSCAPKDVDAIKREIGLNSVPHISEHIVGLIGWIQPNKRWDILTSMWEEIHNEILQKTGERWTLLAAGAMRDPAHKSDYENYKEQVIKLEEKGIAHYYEFIPRGEIYYKVMGSCDFIVLPSTDETQSGTLARIFALNKPYITTAPMEGLTSQTLESGGGLLFTNKKMLKDAVIKLAADEKLRFELSNNLKRYLESTVSWEVVANQYAEAHEISSIAKMQGKKVELPMEF
jgi:glycosyltransferase involved in cell wall biosynthesis